MSLIFHGRSEWQPYKFHVKFFGYALNFNKVLRVDDGSFPAGMRNFLFSVGAQDIFVQLPEIQLLLLDGFLKCNTVKALDERPLS